MREVALELGGELAIEAVALERARAARDDATRTRASTPHACFCGAKNRAMMPVVRSHSRASFASCLRPARVSE